MKSQVATESCTARTEAARGAKYSNASLSRQSVRRGDLRVMHAGAHTLNALHRGKKSGVMRGPGVR